jgi:murein DD-endopeptidase MepM/ murein hydrolase activator NlpD
MVLTQTLVLVYNQSNRNKNHMKSFILAFVILIQLPVLVINSIPLATTPQVEAKTHSTVKQLTDVDLPAGFFTNPAPQGQISREIEFNHDGLDLWADYNSPILAAADGQVIYTQTSLQSSGGYGYYILLQHSHNQKLYYTLYAHLAQAPSLIKGDQVFQGDQIGLMGSTGQATGVHLHFSILTDLRLENNSILNHPTCLKQYGAYASTCISPLDDPINITSYSSVARSSATKPQANPAFTSANLINLETTATGSPITYDQLSAVLIEVFVLDTDKCPAESGTPRTAGRTPKETLITQCRAVLERDSNRTLQNTTVTRQEFAAALMDSIRNNSQGKNALAQTVIFVKIDDVDRSNQEYSTIQRLIGSQIMQLNGTQFNPNQQVTRGEAAAMILTASELVYN